MSTLERFPSKAKRQKRKRANEAATREEQEQEHQRSPSSEEWRLKAKEAQYYRDSSVNTIKFQPIPELQARSPNCLNTPKVLLDEGESIITAWSPDEIVRHLACGDVKSETVTSAFLRRAGIAAKLVRPQESSKEEDN
jgi:hypothetical protein